MVLGHLQRGGGPSTFDRLMATQFGAHAVRLVMEGRFGEMVCSNPPAINSVPIMDAVNRLKQVHPQCSSVQAARAMGISFGDRVDRTHVPLTHEDSDARLGLDRVVTVATQTQGVPVTPIVNFAPITTVAVGQAAH